MQPSNGKNKKPLDTQSKGDIQTCSRNSFSNRLWRQVVVLSPLLYVMRGTAISSSRMSTLLRGAGDLGVRSPAVLYAIDRRTYIVY